MFQCHKKCLDLQAALDALCVDEHGDFSNFPVTIGRRPTSSMPSANSLVRTSPTFSGALPAGQMKVQDCPSLNPSPATVSNIHILGCLKQY